MVPGVKLLPLACRRVRRAAGPNRSGATPYRVLPVAHGGVGAATGPPTMPAVPAPGAGCGAPAPSRCCTCMPALGGARTGRHQGARALQLHHAHPAGVHRRQVVGESTGLGVVDAGHFPAGIQNRRPLGSPAPRYGRRSVSVPPCGPDPSPSPASIAISLMLFQQSQGVAPTAAPPPRYAPVPQIEASPITCARSPSSARSAPPAPSRHRRASDFFLACRTYPARHALAARLVAEEAARYGAGCRGSRCSAANGITTPEPRVEPILPGYLRR